MISLTGLRIIFFGMGGVFSRAPLEALLRAGVDLRAVVEPAPDELAGNGAYTRLEPSRWAASGAARRGLPMAGVGGAPAMAARTIRENAASAGAPVYSVRRLRDPQFLAEMAAYQPDAICVACFTKKLPPELLAVPRLGALNAHPSLLPKGRGPDPLFWFFHRGDHHVGLTIHLMDNFLDGGPILLQQTLMAHEALSESQLEAQISALAGDMLTSALAWVAAGTWTPEPQDDIEATYEDWPLPEDYAIDPTWNIERAERFVTGVYERGQPIIIIARDGVRFRIRSAATWGLQWLGFDGEPNKSWNLDGKRLDVLLANGLFSCLAERLD